MDAIDRTVPVLEISSISNLGSSQIDDLLNNYPSLLEPADYQCPVKYSVVENHFDMDLRH